MIEIVRLPLQARGMQDGAKSKQAEDVFWAAHHEHPQISLKMESRPFEFQDLRQFEKNLEDIDRLLKY